MTKEEFLQAAKQAAANIGTPWPGYVAAEAALESAFGCSQLCKQGNNLFGRKQSALHPVYETLDMPTKEYLHGDWVTVQEHWVKFPDWEASLRDRQALLIRLAPEYRHYQAALNAPDGPTFVLEVSQTWSTDPQRADKVLAIYNEYVGILG